MNAKRWNQIKEIFSNASELSGAERDRFLTAACKGDPGLQHELLKLLDCHERNADFLSHPPAILPGACDLSMTLAPGQTIAERFSITRFIARGGMGEVYEAYDLVLEERIALKVLPAYAHRAGMPLKTEIQSARRVTHPNVCRFHDVVEHGDPPQMLLTMELLEGPTLSQYLREHGPFPRAQALPIIRQLCEGLQSAHDAGVVHRDFKCGNIILTRNPDGWRPVITDFGLAIPAGNSSGAPGPRGGTPGYMAPEQLRGDRVTAATDVYALGVVISELIGARPAGNEAGAPGPEERLGAWKRAVGRCLESIPDRRYQRPRDVLSALAVVQRRRTYGLVSAVFAGLVILAIASYWQSGRPVKPAAAFVSRTIAEVGEKYTFCDPSPDGKWVLAIDNESKNLVLCDFARGVFRPVTPKAARPEEEAGLAKFSRDGKTIAYHRGRLRQFSELRLVDSDGRNDRLLFRDPDSWFVRPDDWSPDGSRIVAHLFGKETEAAVSIISVHTGASTKLFYHGARGAGEIVRFSPDGAEVWFDAPLPENGGIRSILAMSLERKRESRVFAESSNANLLGISPDGRQLVLLSDRKSNNALWTAPLSNGRPAGAPRHVADVGWIRPLGLTREGALYYTTGGATRSLVYVAEVDIQKKTTIAGPKRVAPSLFGFQLNPVWSRGGQLSFSAQGEGAHSLLLVFTATGVLREIPQRGMMLSSPQWRTNEVLAGFDFARGAYVQVDVQTGRTELLEHLVQSGPTRFAGAWSSDGRVWYNSVEKTQSGATQYGSALYRYDVRLRNRRLLFAPKPGFGIAPDSLVLSPDDNSLAFLLHDVPDKETGTLMLLPVSGGEVRPLWTMKKPDPLFARSAFTWLPDSKRLLAAISRNQISELWLVPISGDERSRVEFPSVRHLQHLRMAPDGTSIAFSTMEQPPMQLGVFENLLPAR